MEKEKDIVGTFDEDIDDGDLYFVIFSIQKEDKLIAKCWLMRVLEAGYFEMRYDEDDVLIMMSMTSCEVESFSSYLNDSSVEYELEILTEGFPL